MTDETKLRRVVPMAFTDADFEHFEFLAGNIKERSAGLAVVMAKANAALQASSVKPAEPGEDPTSEGAMARMTAGALALASLVILGLQFVPPPGKLTEADLN